MSGTTVRGILQNHRHRKAWFRQPACQAIAVNLYANDEDAWLGIVASPHKLRCLDFLGLLPWT